MTPSRWIVCCPLLSGQMQAGLLGDVVEVVSAVVALAADQAEQLVRKMVRLAHLAGGNWEILLKSLVKRCEILLQPASKVNE